MSTSRHANTPHATTDRKLDGHFTRCPECGAEDLKTSRALWRLLVGGPIALVGLALALPTLGVTLVLFIWGVFIVQPRKRCTRCGWKQ